MIPVAMIGKAEAMIGTALSAVSVLVVVLLYFHGYIMTGSFLMGGVIFGTGLYFFLVCLLSGGYGERAYLRGLGRIRLAGFGIAALAAGGIGLYMAIFRSISAGHRVVLVFTAAIFSSGAAVIFRRALSGGERD